MAETFGQGNVPWWTNPQRILLAKILNAIAAGGGGGGGSGTGQAGIVGLGSPEGVVTAKPGTSYYDITNPGAASEWFKESGVGNTGWQQLQG